MGTCGRKLHAQQQEVQSVYECIDKVTQFMSRAAIFSFMPILTKILPESITNIERGRYYRNRFLTKEGSLISDKPGFLPYGVGPRICPGAELADMKMFLIIANMIATFNLSLPPADDGDLGTQFEAGTAVLRNPKPFRTVFDLRS